MKMLNCSQFQEIKVARKEIVNCDKNGKPDKQQCATVDETWKSQ